MEKWVVRPFTFLEFKRGISYLVWRKPLQARCLRPLPPLAAVAAAGVWAANGRTGVCLAPCCLVAIILFVIRVRLSPSWLTVLLPLLFAASALLAFQIVLPARSQAALSADRTFDLIGRVIGGEPVKGQLLVRQTNGARIWLTGLSGSPGIGRGDIINARVWGIDPPGRRNPGGFDESAWLAAQGVYLKARVVSGGSAIVVRQNVLPDLYQAGADCRQRLADVLPALLGDERAALLTGLLLGDTSGISDSQKSDFRSAGLSHLMSVSGANIAFLLAPATQILRKGRVRRSLRLVLLLLLLLAFGYLTGWQVSVTRACLMAFCMLFGKLLHRPVDSISSLSAASLLMTIADPMTALQTGFWLSLAATGSLVIFTGPLADQLRRRLTILTKTLSTILAAPICVQMALLPLTVPMSSSLSWVSLPANLLAGPLTAMISWLALPMMPLAWLITAAHAGGLAISLARAAASPLTACLDLLSSIADTAAGLPGGRISSAFLNPAFWLAWLLTAVVWTGNRQHASGAWKRLASRLKGLRMPLLAAWLVILSLQIIAAPAAQVWFFDVGQGDAILILNRQGESILIDGGKVGQGCQVLLPALDALGVRQIDLAIATHGHADHVGGLIELAAAGRIGRLAVSRAAVRIAESSEPPAADRIADLLKMARKEGIMVSEIDENDTIALGPDILLRVLNNADRLPDAAYAADINEMSLLLLASLSGHTALLTADCTESLEAEMLADGLWPQADILKVAHHGSKLASSEAFLSAVRPRTAIISVGSNLYGHPAGATLDRLDEAGCTTLRTDRHGAVSLQIWPDTCRVSVMCPYQH